MTHEGRQHDVIDPAVTHAFVKTWCAASATIELRNSQVPSIAYGSGAGHIMNMPAQYTQAIQWLVGRFNGTPPNTTC